MFFSYSDFSKKCTQEGSETGLSEVGDTQEAANKNVTVHSLSSLSLWLLRLSDF